jgi:suppressor of ftsI/bilirubin oxidase
MPFSRRRFIRGVSAAAIASLDPWARADHAVAAGAPPTLSCGAETATALLIPRDRGFLGRLPLDERTLSLRAAPVPAGAALPGGLTQAYLASADGRDFVNPTLVLRRGQRVRIDLVNALADPTIVHWHGLAVDTRDDGGGTLLAVPGATYRYDFALRNRASLYWYHPHPHGLTAGQAYRGLFGMIEVSDEDEDRLRAALDLVQGQSEIPLVLQDRRAGSDYGASEMDKMHGFLGDRVLINGTSCPQLSLATRIYRFRVLNASNARTYRLGWRTSDGKPFAFTLIGNDGGLLPAPRPCAEAFIASAERLDMLLDLSELAAGDALVLETRGFDPMHMEMATAPASGTAAPASGGVDHAAMGHVMPPKSGSDQTGADGEHAVHGGAFPEGAVHALLAVRVHEKIAYGARVPARLAALPAIDVAGANERPLRLGFAKGRWRINDRVFAMGETPIEVKRDSVEIWLIRNYFNSMPHAMHLHGFAFEVLARETSPDALAPLRIDDRGRLASDDGRKDTVLVWPGESVRIAVDFTCPFPGDQTYMFHCHNLEHEDGGMMLGVKVS